MRAGGAFGRGFAGVRGSAGRGNIGRRGTVLIMVVGVLAMLFIVGSTLLIVARFERQTSEKLSYGQNIGAVLDAVAEPVLSQLRDDIVGSDGTPYNRPWNLSESSTIEDSADFPGVAGLGESVAERMRSGDLLTGSVAPYPEDPSDLLNSKWFHPWISSALDGVPTGYTADLNNIKKLPVFLTQGPAMEIKKEGPPYTELDPQNTYAFDVDGDGIRDLGDSAVLGQTAGMFGSQYLVGLRVVPHGGMVLVDRFTHPLLLAQVIHPEDKDEANNYYYKNPQWLWPKWFNLDTTGTDLTTNAADEGRVRRRFILPADLGKDSNGNALTTDNLDESDLRHKLPVTLGYVTPTAAPAAVSDLGPPPQTPHWWPVDDTVVHESTYTDNDWWTLRLAPPTKALTETGYDASTDVYDRRHMLTTVNSDDVLRVQREESRLASTLYPGQVFIDTSTGKPVFGEVLGPQADATTDSGSLLTALPALTPLPWATPFQLLDSAAPYVPGVGGNTYSRRYFDYGRDDDGNLRFNVPGLRTQFSLRDVLDPYTGQGTYQKVVQLTAYFLAMIQHTSLPGSDEINPALVTDEDQWDQLETAMQLAVNAIDFADNDGNVDADPQGIPDQVNTYFEWPASSPKIKVMGVEKQPFITEAYVKLVVKAKSDGSGWDTTTSVDANSIYAVELYNPYPVPLSLKGYELNVLPNVDLGELVGGQGTVAPQNQGAMRPYSYIVIANRSDDVALTGPFITGAVEGGNLFIDTNVRIRSGDNVALSRTGKRILKLAPDGFEYPATSLAEPMEVDELTASRTVAGLGDNYWAGIPHVTIDDQGKVTNISRWPAPQDGTDMIVRDTSLQRHKDLYREQYAPLRFGFVPRNWHFTLSLQGQFPPAAYESFTQSGLPAPNNRWPKMYAEPIGFPLSYTADRPRQHNLLCTVNKESSPKLVGTPQAASIDNQVLLGIEFQGVGLVQYKPFAGSYPLVTIDGTQVSSFQNVDCGHAHDPIAPLPMVTADRGIDSLTGGTLAFPTTGTLLLVSRYAHMEHNRPGASETICAPAQATRLPPGVDDRDILSSDPLNPGQLQQIDNGHLPIFDKRILIDPGQMTSDLTYVNTNNTPPDGPQSRLDVPWGQLIYEYFTALPLEELTRAYNYTAINATYFADYTNGVRMVDLAAGKFEDTYRYFFDVYDVSGRRTSGYPLVDPVAEAQAEKGSPLGPRVRGRINVNYAPWWVLDGLPVLPDGPVGTNLAIPPAPQTQSLYPLAGLPIPELWSGALDPANYPADSKAGALMAAALFDLGNPDAGAGTAVTDYLPSVSPTLAKYLVSWVEGRMVDTLDARYPVLKEPPPVSPPLPQVPQRNAYSVVYPPGLVSVGSLAALVHRPDLDTPGMYLGIPVKVRTIVDGTSDPELIQPLGQLRLHTYHTNASDPNTAVKPYAYLGWLQLVAPLVRLEDWATVRNHVFTIYASVGDTTDPQLPLWMRKQVTVDRTACLYKDELPQKVTETLPIAYQNAVDDK